MSMLVIVCVALFTLALTGRLPAALAILTALAPLAVGWWRARQESGEGMDPFFDEHTEVKTKSQALEILGLDDEANEDDIKAAYKRLMQKVHPDHEGSEWMAAKLNQAREILLGK